MRFRTLFASIFLPLPISAVAAPSNDAYQAGYELGHAIGQALPFIVAGAVVVAIWLLVRARSKRKRSRSAEPQA